MKTFLLEIFDPVIDFYKIRTKGEKTIIVFIPMLSGIACYVVAMITNGNEAWDGYGFSTDILNQLITILTLFVSFSMAYLSIIVASSSKNIDNLKATPSKDRLKPNGDPYSLYQILVCEITYTLIFEIVFLIFCVFEKFLINIIQWQTIRILICLDVMLFIHVLIMMLVVVKNIYFSFWKSE